MLAVVDENVLVVANDLTKMSLGTNVSCPEASDECRLSCVQELSRLAADGGLVLDAGSEFFDKYRTCASLSGQPGVGDLFLKMIFERGYDSSWCTRVDIRDGELFRLSPEILASGFDRDDLCWLAAAYNCTEAVEVLNAVDSDYQDWAGVIGAAGIQVREICG